MDEGNNSPAERAPDRPDGQPVPAMMEKVARAIYANSSGEERPDFDAQPASVKRFYSRQARAAIAAMRKSEVTWVSCNQFAVADSCAAIWAWNRAIDAALK